MQIRIGSSLYSLVYTNSYYLISPDCHVSLILGDTWDEIKGTNGCRLIIGQFAFRKKASNGFIASNKCRDVLAALKLTTKLLEEFSVPDSHSYINDS